VLVLSRRPVLPISLHAAGPAERSSAQEAFWCWVLQRGAQQGFGLRFSLVMSLGEAGLEKAARNGVQERCSLGALIGGDNRVTLT